MKFIIKTILIALLAAGLQSFFPWWSVAISGFVISTLMYKNGASSFFAGFIAISLLWSIKAYFIDVANEQILSTKIAALFTITPILLIVITGVIGGLVTGFASITGTSFAALFRTTKKSRNKYYS